MTQTYRFDDRIREVITSAIPEETSLFSKTPELRFTYLPASHAKALRPDNVLVVGIRGAGKSFWWSALQSKEHRAMFGDDINLGTDARISVGFGEIHAPQDYPGKDTLNSLLEKAEPRLIWKVIVFKHFSMSADVSDFHSINNWEERLQWVKKNPDVVDSQLYKVDEELSTKRNYHLVLFDALDRTADDWKTMNTLVKGLLQTAVDFRSYRRLRLKVFVRPDQIEDAEVTAFPDSSKILSQKTDLYWPRNELYALLWQYLANADNGNVFREGARKLLRIEWEQKENVWLVPDGLRRNEHEQRELFHSMTGPWMGRDKRRGFPYTWLPNHLGDTRNQVSPRSFLAAVRHAAEDPKRQDQKYAIHYESIKRGVQKASTIRVRELKEDYPWIDELLSVLSGTSVPCTAHEIEQIWQEKKVLETLSQKIESATVRLPPAHIDGGVFGVLKDLEGLGLIDRLSDDRINIPDVYRVGFGIKRRGGVKPAAR
jgi:hypothetical protein